MSPSTIFVESLNFSTFIQALTNKNIRKIFVLDSVDFFESNKARASYYAKILSKLRKNLIVSRAPNYERFEKRKLSSDICWSANKTTLDFLESEDFDAHVQTWIPSFVSQDMYLGFKTCFKKVYMAEVFQKVLFYQQEAQFSRTGQPLDQVLSTRLDFLNIRSYLTKKNGFESSAKNSAVLYFAEPLKAAIFLLASPYLLRDIFRRGLSLKAPKIQSFDLANQVIWGFTGKEFKSEREETVHLGDAEIQTRRYTEPSKILYTLGRPFGKKITRPFVSAQKALIEPHGPTATDESRLRIPISVFVRYYFFRGFLSLFLLGMKNQLRHPTCSSPIKAIQRIYVSYLTHLVFCSHFRVKVFFSRDDYDLDHVTRTLVQRKYGLLNHGLQHSALQEPHLIPFMAYPYFDTYYITGEGFKDLWKPFWEANKSFITVGNRTDEKLVRALASTDRKSEFVAKYGEGKKILLLISPVSNQISPAGLLKERYTGLEKLTALAEDVKLILRPRSERAIEDWKQLFPDIVPGLEEGSIHFEWGDFSTHELMAFSDVLVAEDSSSTILETIHLDHLFVTSINARYPTINLLEGVSCENIPELVHMLSHQWLSGANSPKRDHALRQLKNSFTLPLGADCWVRIAKNISEQVSHKSA